MQCSSCQFENMPGVSNCGRCGAVLNSSPTPIDVYPPRARKWTKPFRRYFYFFTRHRIIPANLDRGLDRMVHNRMQELYDNRIPWRTLLRMFVPGWNQFYFNRKLQGRIFLWGYLFSLPLGILFAGTGYGGLLLGAALSLHAASIIDIVIANTRDREYRLVYSLFSLILVGMLTYLPAVELVTRYATPQQFLLNSPPFQRGDVVLYNTRAYVQTLPQIGDMVIFRLPNMRVPVGRQGHANVLVQFVGQTLIGRVVAGPGQQITFQNGNLFVDGRLSPWSQAFSEQYTEAYLNIVPTDRYFIMTGLPMQIPQQVWLNNTIVKSDSIIGKVYFRTQPLWRFGYIR